MEGLTHEQVVKLAYESGVSYHECGMTDEIFALVTLAYAAGQTFEREACAQLAKAKHVNATTGSKTHIAAAIRARGKNDN